MPILAPRRRAMVACGPFSEENPFKEEDLPWLQRLR